MPLVDRNPDIEVRIYGEGGIPIPGLRSDHLANPFILSYIFCCWVYGRARRIRLRHFATTRMLRLSVRAALNGRPVGAAARPRRSDPAPG
jgi:hypothetical protein